MPGIQVWVVDPLTKVFPHDRWPRNAPRSIALEAARNDTESGQVAVRSTTGVTVRPIASPLVHADGDARIDAIQVQPVRFVYLDAQTPGTPKARLVHRAPDLFPDILTEEAEVYLQPNQTQPLWLTVRVPASAKPGAYRGALTLTGARETVVVPVELQVYGARVPEARSICAGEWLSADGPLARHIPGAAYPREGFFSVMQAVARNMRAHRQNVLRVPFGPSANGLIGAAPAGIDGLVFDFTAFDRLVEIFIAEGAADLVAGAHLAGPPSHQPDAQEIMVRGLLNVGGCIAAADLRPGTPACQTFLRHYLTGLHRHLELKGWTRRYVQHVFHRPVDGNAAAYQALAGQVKALLPGVRVIEAVDTIKVTGNVDVWVPRLDFLAAHQRWFRDRQRDGAEVWFCTAAEPVGPFPNRFIDRSLLDVRLIHWMNFAFKATGYLHLAYNRWAVEDPSKETRVQGAPGGEAWIVYPGREGVLDSIRHETMRDGLEDYELLRLLEADHPRQALTLVKSVVKSATNYTSSIATFRKARRQLLELVSA